MNDTIETAVVSAEMLCMIAALIYTITKARKDTRSSFFVTVCALLLAVDISTILLNVTYTIEDYTSSIWIPIWEGLGNCVFQCASNCVHWIFAFKYHVISREIPKSMRGIVDKKVIKRYQITNVVMIVLCVALGLYTGLVRGIFAENYSNDRLANQ